MSTTERLREVAKQFEKGDQRMTTRELLQMALNALEYQIENFPLEAPRLLPPIGEIRAHLAKPEPEPVAGVSLDGGSPQLHSKRCLPDGNTPLYTKDQL